MMPYAIAGVVIVLLIGVLIAIGLVVFLVGCDTVNPLDADADKEETSDKTKVTVTVSADEGNLQIEVEEGVAEKSEVLPSGASSTFALQKSALQ